MALKTRKPKQVTALTHGEASRKDERDIAVQAPSRFIVAKRERDGRRLREVVRMIRSFVLTLAITTYALAAYAQGPYTQEAMGTRIGAVTIGVTMGVLFHEFAHAMIGELGLPATGPEEDTADEFSALLMGELASVADHPVLVDVATYSSFLWFHLALAKERAGQSHPWRDEHAPDIRRFRHSFCMLFGSNPALYSGLADRHGFDQRFKARCLDEYAKRSKAWESIVEPSARNLGADFPGLHPADAPGGRINVVFRPTSNRYMQMVELPLEEMLVALVGELSRYLVWPRDLLVEFRDCGTVSAHYDPGLGAITMCYEMIEYASQTVLQAEGIASAPAPGASALAFVQGTWWMRLNTVYGLLDVAITYQPDQTYRSDEVWVQSGILAARVAGTWAAELATPNQLLIHRRPDEWLPQAACYYDQAACQPYVGQSVTYPAQIIDQNTMHVDGVVWQRMR